MLFWYACFFLSIIPLVLGITMVVRMLRRPDKLQKGLSLLKYSAVLAVSAAVSGLILLMPVSALELTHVEDAVFRAIQTFLLSIHTTIRLFVADADFSSVIQAVMTFPYVFRMVYSLLALILFVLAPATTFGAVASFLASLFSYWRVWLSYGKDKYVFSELNAKSLALATDIKRRSPGCLLIFTDVYDKEDEESQELLEQAKLLGAAIFHNDVTVLNLRHHSPRAALYFFLIGENEAENINQALILASPPAQRKGELGGYDYERDPRRIKAMKKGEKLEEIHPFKKYSKYDPDFVENNSVLKEDIAAAQEIELEKDVRIYLFATSESSEQQLSALTPRHLLVRRINDVQSLIFHHLYESGDVLFRGRALKDGETDAGDLFSSSSLPTVPVYDAVPVKDADGNTVLDEAGMPVMASQQTDGKLISAVVVGMGKHGTEMVKALSWFCQMPGYRLEINAFDKDEHAEDRFRARCPELMQEGAPVDGVYPDKLSPEHHDEKQYNGDFTTLGDAHYSIRIHGSVDVDCYDFVERLKALEHVSYVLVALGDDDLNIRVAANIRVMLRRLGREPVIQAIVYDPRKQQVLSRGITNYADVGYDVQFIGDLTSNYSVSCILQPSLEDLALARHIAYTYKYFTDEDTPADRLSKVEDAIRSFYSYDYNYRSSTASVIHRRYKLRCGIGGISVSPSKRTGEQTQVIRYLEHQRWNAFVRADGFSLPLLGQRRDKLAKTHHLLIPFDILPEDEKRKDDD